MRIRALSVIVLVVVVLASCRFERRPIPIAAKPSVTSDNTQFTVIGTMQNRDRLVTVKTGPAGIVYSIATKDGKSLYENISPERLKAEAPALHESIESGTAGYAGLIRGELKFDARIFAGK